MAQSSLLLLAIATLALCSVGSARPDAMLQRPSQINVPRQHSIVNEVVSALQARFLPKLLQWCDNQLRSGARQYLAGETLMQLCSLLTTRKHIMARFRPYCDLGYQIDVATAALPLTGCMLTIGTLWAANIRQTRSWMRS